MQDEHLGEKSPSEIRRRLRRFGDSSSDNTLLFRKLFFLCLPPCVQSILAPILNASTMAQIVVMADKIIEFPAQPATKTTGGDSL